MSYALPIAETLSEAWLLGLERTVLTGGREVHLIFTISEPGREVSAVRAVLDELLTTKGKATTTTVAETIFPSSLYADPGFAWEPGLDADKEQRLDDAAAGLFDSYSSMLPLLLTASGNASGTYFSRMMSWPGRTTTGTNQVQLRIDGLRSQQSARRRTNNTLDIDVAADCLVGTEAMDGIQIYAPTDRRTRGFPCLTHLDFTLYQGRLHCTAVYRHHYLVEKAYGNFVGLSALMAFLAQQSGYEIGELVVHATMADGQRSFADGAGLVTAARAALGNEGSP